MGLNWQAMPACGRVAFTLCFLAAAAACARSTPELLLEVPAELQGTWRAEDADWEGAYLDFRALFVEIGRVDGDSDLYPVVGVTVDAQPRVSFYDVHYSDSSGRKYALRVLIDSREPQVLMMQNRRHVGWRREAV